MHHKCNAFISSRYTIILPWIIVNASFWWIQISFFRKKKPNINLDVWVYMCLTRGWPSLSPSFQLLRMVFENGCSPNLRWRGTGVAGLTLGTIVSLHGTLHMISLSFPSSYTFSAAPHPPPQPGRSGFQLLCSTKKALPNQTMDWQFLKKICFKDIKHREKKHNNKAN